MVEKHFVFIWTVDLLLHFTMFLYPFAFTFVITDTDAFINTLEIKVQLKKVRNYLLVSLSVMF